MHEVSPIAGALAGRCPRCLVGLRWAKALLLTQEYHHRAHEGRISQ